MEDRKFYEVTCKLAKLVEYGGKLKPACEQCPYAERCREEELYYECGAWEKAMGEDV